MFERKKQAGKIYFLPIDQIRPSPFQARREFSEQELAALAQSIRENGLLQPISVRKVSDGGYELVAGERRLRACRLAKMNTIPAILCDYDDERTAALGLLENIQRADLNPFEQAQGLKDVMVLWDCTQAEAAKRLGMAQPTLANKLRLLQLNADQRQFVLDNSLTERHARAVLRLPENRRSEALINIAKRRMNARQTDLYIEQLLNTPAKGRHRISTVKLFHVEQGTNSFSQNLTVLPAPSEREPLACRKLCNLSGSFPAMPRAPSQRGLSAQQTGEFSPQSVCISAFPPLKVKNPAEKRFRWFKNRFGCAILGVKVPVWTGNRRA